MERVIQKGVRTGAVTVPSSKSQAHRYLICAALSEHPSRLACRGISEDVRATARCLEALGAKIGEAGDTLFVEPVRREGGSTADAAELLCGESGSTLRFLLPLTGALGAAACFHMEGRLGKRPHSAFAEELRRHGMTVEQRGAQMFCGGRLQPGSYHLPGNISSQFITGLLLALPLLDGESSLEIDGELQSADYVAITEQALALSGIKLIKAESGYRIPGNQHYRFPAEAEVEGDWSSAAPFLCMGALSKEGVRVEGLATDSAQGDRRILDILRKLGAEIEISADGVHVRKGSARHGVGARQEGRDGKVTIDAADIPDLIPALCALAATADGCTEIVNAGRLRLKETDRIRTTVGMLRALGAAIEEKEEGMVIIGKEQLDGGTTSSYGDHRIAMAAAVAACACREDVVLQGAECVAKSYPGFWDDWRERKEP